MNWQKIERNPWPLLGLIFLLAVILRVAVAFYLGNSIDAPALLTDQRSYHALGTQLTAGYGFSFDRPFYPFGFPADTPTSHWSFLYSLFVAAVYCLFGANPLAVRLVQAIIGGILLPWLVFRLAKTMLSEQDRFRGVDWIPLVAAGITAVYGYYILYAATIMTETLYISVVVWSLERGLRLAHWWRGEHPPTQPWLLVVTFGISLGLAALLRQAILPWLPFMFLYLLYVGWRNGRFQVAFTRLFVAGLILLAFILPFTYRNYRVYDDFLLLNSNTGYAMYSAQHPMHGTQFREFEAAPLPDDLPRLNEAQLDRELLKRGFQFIQEDPQRYLRLSLSRVRAYFEFWPSADTTLLHNLGRVGSFGLFLPFMLYGLFLSFRQPDFVKRNRLLYLFILIYTLLHLLTWAMVRYRLPVDAVLILFAGIGLVDLAARAANWKIWPARVKQQN
jgi:4-amino-4-deoxy-L-arabinose transferase-like glycosyltransferase